ncbi:MAG: protein kinase [Bacteroides sp.]|nr:protein kinase [Bacteroides sp.]MBD5340451.1 protein kinase [Bacteroides sp.]
MMSESILTPAEGEESGVAIELYKEKSINTLWIMVRDGRRYILKGLSASRRNHPQEVARLRKEYSLGVRLNHPGVAATYGFEDHSVTGPVIVTEYVDGVTLDEFLDSSPGYGVRLRVAKELGDALAYIHQQGLAHRDLKPDNIIIGRRMNEVKLIDFGLADSDDSVIYKKSMATKEFGAPEQQQPSEGDAGADIYSYGKILETLLPERKFKKLIAMMLKENPAARPTMPEVLKELDSIESGGRISRWIISLVVFGLVCGIVGVYLFTRDTNEVPVLEDNVAAEPAIVDSLPIPASAELSPVNEVSTDEVPLVKEEIKQDNPLNEVSGEEIIKQYVTKQDSIFQRYGKLDITSNDRKVDVQRLKRYEEMGELAKVAEGELKKRGVPDAKVGELLNSFWISYVYKMNDIDGVNDAAGRAQAVIDSVNRALKELGLEE